MKAASEDNKWRVRLQLLDNICKLAVIVKVTPYLIQNFDFYIKHLEPLYLIFLGDRASGVRNVGIKAVPTFAKILGDNWINSFIPKLE